MRDLLIIVVLFAVAVAGAVEIPVVARQLARTGNVDAIVGLGAVIRGETSHYDYVCTESARKLQDLACQYALAVGYGILTCETHEQAWARADVAGKNKGRDAAAACLRMLDLKRHFHLYPR